MNLQNFFPHSKNDDALIQALQNQVLTPEQLAAIQSAASLHDKVVAILQTVHDPEISVNVWDLGLIYKLEARADSVIIDMTLTAPNCPVADAIPAEVKNRIHNFIPELQSVIINLVWEPRWSKEMMSEIAKLSLDMW